jgi:sirohydrochlorin cobaltochelatase
MKRILPLILSLVLLAPTFALGEAQAVKPVILVVSFGTSYNDSRELTIGAIEKLAQESFPDYEVRRAFTSQIIIDKLASRDGLVIDNVSQALERLVADGVKDLVIQPSHVMNGREYDQMSAEIAPYKDKFASFKVGLPLLSSAEDYKQLVEEIAPELPEAGEGEAIVFMGHGTEHFANSAYAALDYVFKDMGHKNVFVGTVEGYPDLETVMRHVAESGASKVTLLPLMIVAGDHANNDMAGDEEGSWKMAFKGEGYEVNCVIKGLGEYQGVREHFVRHIQDAIEGAHEEG